MTAILFDALSDSMTLYVAENSLGNVSAELGDYASVHEFDGKIYFALDDDYVDEFIGTRTDITEVTNNYQMKQCFDYCIKLSGYEGDDRIAKAAILGISVDEDALEDDQAAYEATL